MRQRHVRFAFQAAVLALASYACNAIVDPTSSPAEGDGGLDGSEADGSSPPDAGAHTDADASENAPDADAADAFPDALDANVPLTCLRSFGDSSEQVTYGVAMDTQGKLFIAGYHAGALDFGSGALPSSDSGGFGGVHVAKFDETCALLWARGWAGGSPGRPSTVTMAVTAAGDVWLAGAQKYTLVNGSDGEVVNQILYGGSINTYAMTLDPLGNICTTGELLGVEGDFGGGPLPSSGANLFVAKLDANGGHIWSKSFGVDATPSTIAAAPNGDVLVTGYYQEDIDFGGGSLGSGGRRSFLARLAAADGSHVWSQGWSMHFPIVATSPGGDVYLGGRIDNKGVTFGPGVTIAPDAGQSFVAKFAGDGGAVWAFGLDDKILGGIAATATDVRTFGNALASYRASDGQVVWRQPLQPLGGSILESTQGLAVGPAGETVAAAGYTGTISTPGHTITSKSQPGMPPLRDIMLLRRP